jgi:hypothetical protein
MALSWSETLTQNVTYVKKLHIDEIRAYLDAHINVGAVTGGHPLATSSIPGFMSAADKAAFNTLVASAGSVVGVGGTAPITSTGSSTNPTIGINAATDSTAGSMSAADKTKLDAMTNIPSRVTALEAKPGTGTLTTITTSIPAITITNPTTTPDIEIANATTSNPGLMSAAEHTKLSTMDGFPMGTIIMWHGDSGTFSSLFDGSGVGLSGGAFAKWKVMWGSAVNGSPFDMRNMFPMGADTPTNSTRASGTNTFSLNGTEVQGEQTHILTNPELPNHFHDSQYDVRTPNGIDYVATGAGAAYPANGEIGGVGGWSANQTDPRITGAAVTVNPVNYWRYPTTTIGNNSAHNNMPPFVRLYFLYKFTA